MHIWIEYDVEQTKYTIAGKVPVWYVQINAGKPNACRKILPHMYSRHNQQNLFKCIITTNVNHSHMFCSVAYHYRCQQQKSLFLYTIFTMQ